jgi:serine/threonine protein kinase
MEVSREYVLYLKFTSCTSSQCSKVNILINSNGHARLAGFSRLTMASDQLTTMFSFREGGTPQWMSPELFYPRKFGFKHSCPTKESDCYALGMVMYEVLSGQIPFATYRPSALVVKIMKGKRPGRPHGKEGELFTDEIWGTLECCWEHQPRDRISASAVLLHLERHQPLLRPPINVNGDAETGSDDQSDTNSGMVSLSPLGPSLITLAL